MDQHKTGLKAIANMQPSQSMLASLFRKERETQLVISFIRSHGGYDIKTADRWMDGHRDEVASFMQTLLNPRRKHERQQVAQQQQAVVQRAQLSQNNGQVTYHHRTPQGIKFSRKACQKKHHRK